MRSISDDFNISVGRVAVAHEFLMTNKNRCDYSRGRGIFGISLALSGGAVYRFGNGESYAVKEGDVIFLTDTAAYTISVTSPYRHYTVNFTADVEARSLSAEGILIHETENTAAFKDIFRELISEREAKRAGYELRSTMQVYALLSELVSELARHREEPPYYKRLLPVKQHIDKSYREEMTLDGLAAMADMSTTNFRRLFLRAFGTTPMRYRDSVRLSVAKDALSTGFTTVTEAAAICGFEDTAYFVRFFRKNTGMTPGEFKNSPYGKEK